MPNDRPSAVPSWAAQVQLFRVRVLIRPSTYQVRTMPKEDVMTMNRLNEIAARAEAASKELDRLAGGNPGTNWRWSIPAQPDRDTDLILSASQMDVPRLVAALKAVEAALAEEAAELGKTSRRLNQQMIDRHPDRDGAVAARYDAYAANATHAAKMVRDTIREALGA